MLNTSLLKLNKLLLLLTSLGSLTLLIYLSHPWNNIVFESTIAYLNFLLILFWTVSPYLGLWKLMEDYQEKPAFLKRITLVNFSICGPILYLYFSTIYLHLNPDALYNMLFFILPFYLWLIVFLLQTTLHLAYLWVRGKTSKV